ncbi:hypothetical protein M0802_012973 [Mischocyttarus mexicanus]|nr:hypothetical protein M0802_013832 [Mischocyttarus mexicanus]KAI4484903.1 hypothetical protein M0802_012973 [Mischocyttarus mexicanus]
MALSKNDPNSYARPDYAVITHIELDLNVDFEKKILSGKAILSVLKTGDVNELILDNRDLNITAVKNAENKSNLIYKIDQKIEYGSRIVVYLPKHVCSSDENDIRYTIEIYYETSPDATALQWLTPEQTAGGEYPFLFSQCEAINARSIVPCQDTPSVKFTYSAQIAVPKHMTALMSAIFNGTYETEKTKVYTFNQTIPIPSYLIAIAVGVLASKKIGPRTTVWAEEKYIEQSAYEFAETETMLQIAESICGRYVWGVYDLLVLPPSFPFGGMENPCLTFVTPTLLAGDRSLANVVAHEIAHSWTGNLVTNANFEHFWLNEGFTMYVERKIYAKMYNEEYREFSALDGYNSLKECVETLGESNQLTKLVPDLAGINPDDAFSVVPYEKGHTLLFFLERTLEAKTFESFLKSYLIAFQYKSIVTSDFKEYLYQYYPDQIKLFDAVDWNRWFNIPGMPLFRPKYAQNLATVCTNLAEKWIYWDETDSTIFKKKVFEDLMPLQKKTVIFEILTSPRILSVNKLEVMQSIYDMDSIKNCEIRCVWLRLCIKSRWEIKVPEALKFATEIGRLKFVRPIFRDLYNWKAMRQTAIDAYLQNKSKMIYITARMLAKDLHLSE